MSSNQQSIAHARLVQRFKQFYADSANLPVDEMDQIYHNDVVFKDPANTLRGLPSLHRYLSNMSASIPECRFEYLDELVSEGTAYIKWDMHFWHPKLGDKPLVLRGVTHIQFAERIVYHEDVYDMGQMIYEHVPLLGRVIRWIKSRLEL